MKNEESNDPLALFPEHTRKSVNPYEKPKKKKKAKTKKKLYTQEDLDKALAEKLADINRLVDSRLNPIKSFDSKFNDFLKSNKALCFYKKSYGFNSSKPYCVKVVDNIFGIDRMDALKMNHGETFQKALMEMPEVNDSDFVDDFLKDAVIEINDPFHELSEEDLQGLGHMVRDVNVNETLFEADKSMEVIIEKNEIDGGPDITFLVDSENGFRFVLDPDGNIEWEDFAGEKYGSYHLMMFRSEEEISVAIRNLVEVRDYIRNNKRK